MALASPQPQVAFRLGGDPTGPHSVIGSRCAVEVGTVALGTRVVVVVPVGMYGILVVVETTVVLLLAPNVGGVVPGGPLQVLVAEHGSPPRSPDSSAASGSVVDAVKGRARQQRKYRWTI